MSSEIGCRNLCDVNRYNLLETIAEKMGLETVSNATLWKDRAMLEANCAVLHSFQKAGVTISDHHSASESFLVHMEKEQKLRGGCPGDWVWIVPPLSGSLCPVFHQEMLNYTLKPSFVYQEEVAKSRQRVFSSGTSSPMTFKTVARVVRFTTSNMRQALNKRFKTTILYATETGRSKQYAERTNQIFSCAFDSKVMCMEEYDLSNLENETILLILTSTFGNGEPPENGEAFAHYIADLVKGEVDKNDNIIQKNGDCPPVQRLSYEQYCGQPAPRKSRHYIETSQRSSLIEMKSPPLLSSVRFSVFGLGSTAYPQFCAFAHALDAQIGTLGGERLVEIATGDELGGQELAFLQWAERVYKEACQTFCIQQEGTGLSATGDAKTPPDSTWIPDKFRAVEAQGVKAPNICQSLYELHSKETFPCSLISCQNLQDPSSGRATVLVKLDTGGEEKLYYEAGDHATVFPTNGEDLVERVLERVASTVSHDSLIQLECKEESDSTEGDGKNKWIKYKYLPVCSLREALLKYLDIAKPPSSQLLKIMAMYATNPAEAEMLTKYGQGDVVYEDWIYSVYPTLADVFDQFPSLRVPASLLLTQLPLLKPRYYSISSSPNLYPGEVHLTVAVVQYDTQDKKATRYGVCSNWLNTITNDITVPLFIRKAAKFHMPADKMSPMILIGPGAGIAPFRSFWQQREFDLFSTTSQDDQKLGDLTLIFGCRRASLDDIYKKETKTAKDVGALSNVWTAYSRDPIEPKTYVQDLLRKNAQMVFDTLFSSGGHVYVCGDVTMATDVAKVIESIAYDHGDMNWRAAKKWISSLKDDNRYHEDIFGVTLRTTEVVTEIRRSVVSTVKNPFPFGIKPEKENGSHKNGSYENVS